MRAWFPFSGPECACQAAGERKEAEDANLFCSEQSEAGFFYHLYIEIPNFNEFVLENYFESRKFDIKYQVQAVGSASKVRILQF